MNDGTRQENRERKRTVSGSRIWDKGCLMGREDVDVRHGILVAARVKGGWV